MDENQIIKQYIDMEGLRKLLELIRDTYVCQNGLTSKIREEVKKLIADLEKNTIVRQCKSDKTDPSEISKDNGFTSWKNGDLLIAENSSGFNSVFYWYDGKWICLSKAPVNNFDSTYSEEELKNIVPTALAIIKNINAEIERERASKIRYEFVKVDGLIVDYREKEIRLNTSHVVPVKQTVGPNGNPNLFYIQAKVYAPENTSYWKEWDGDTLSIKRPTDTTGFVGKDKYGRVYSTFWCPIAQYTPATDTWSKWGDKSTIDKYLGFNYRFEWYDINDKLIDSDKIRVLLTNDSCHNDLVPESVNKRIDEKLSKINIDGVSINIATYEKAGTVMPNSAHFDLATNGLMSIKSVPVNLISGLEDKVKSLCYTKEEVNHLILEGTSAKDMASTTVSKKEDLDIGLPIGSIVNVTNDSGSVDSYILTATSDGTKQWELIEHEASITEIAEKVAELAEKTDNSGAWDTF